MHLASLPEAILPTAPTAASAPQPRPGPVAEPAPAQWLALDTPAGQAGFTDWEGTGPQAVAVSHFQVGGIDCAGCAPLIETALRCLPGVISAEVNAGSLHAAVRWRGGSEGTRPSEMLAAIREAGYDAAPDIAVGARVLRQREQRALLWRLFVAGFCMMQIMMYATPAYLAAPGDMSPDIQRLLQWAGWVLSLPVMLFAAGPFWRGAWQGLRQRRIGMDLPVSLGLAVTFVAGTGAAFDPGPLWGREVYFDSLSMFVFFLLAGRWVAMRLRHRMAARLEGLVACWPEVVQRLDERGGVTLVSPQALQPGDLVRVLAGQAVPADGVLEGQGAAGLVDESLLSGESLPVPKGAGSPVVAGSLNLQGPLLVRVERVGRDTRMEGIRALMRQALSQRPAAAQLADRWAGRFLWTVLALAAAGALAWWWIEPARALWVAASVLIVTCPCALSLAAPAAWLSAAGALARRGVLLNRFEALEALSQVDRMVFDKTGTLTEDRMVMTGCRLQPLAQGHDLSWVQTRAADLARQSLHPLSRALADAVPPGATPWLGVREHPGLGLEARDAHGAVWRLGSAAWVGQGDGEYDGDGRRLWFGQPGVPWAAFEFEEVLRPDAAQAVRALQAEGVQLAILSGDRADRVSRVAAQLGIALHRGEATPEDKLDWVRAAQQAGHRVAMVGDGLNDAPVLAQADVSLAVAHDASLRLTQAQSHADAVLLSRRLGEVAAARRIARRALRVLRQNLAWAAGYNLLCIPLALSGHLPPWAAGLGMALSSLAVVLNAQRIARQA